MRNFLLGFFRVPFIAAGAICGMYGLAALASILPRDAWRSVHDSEFGVPATLLACATAGAICATLIFRRAVRWADRVT
jgi:hypothetical protein